LYALRARVRRVGRRPHLGRFRPRGEREGRHRHGPAVGRVGHVYVVREVLHGLPHRSHLPQGHDRRRDGPRPRETRIPGQRPGEEAVERLRIATVWLGGCSGCHMSFLDLDEYLIDLVAIADVVFTPVMDVKEYPQNVDAVLVEGAVANEDNLEMLLKVRERSRMLISLGDCAVTGNVTAIRNPIGKALPVLERSYLELADLTPQIPDERGIIPRLLDRVV